ncbi:MAG: hypothetical protein U0838_11445 [Chloroflexota bacterium]
MDGLLRLRHGHLHATATGVPVIQLETIALDIERRSLLRFGVDWYTSPA